MKLVMDVIDEAPRPVEPDRLLPSDEHPQQAIKSDEVVDMCVRDEDVLEALNLARRQVRRYRPGQTGSRAFQTASRYRAPGPRIAH